MKKNKKRLYLSEEDEKDILKILQGPVWGSVNDIWAILKTGVRPRLKTISFYQLSLLFNKFSKDDFVAAPISERYCLTDKGRRKCA